MTKKVNERPKVPRWVSDKGYWVVESNINHPGSHTIWFYNNDNVLMYKETLQGVKLDADKRKVKMKLKKSAGNLGYCLAKIKKQNSMTGKW